MVKKYDDERGRKMMKWKNHQMLGKFSTQNCMNSEVARFWLKIVLKGLC